MSKKNKDVVNEPVDQTQPESKQPAFVEELLKNGTVMLTALDRDDLAAMVNEIPADCKYGVGAVGHNPSTGVFSLRVDLC